MTDRLDDLKQRVLGFDGCPLKANAKACVFAGGDPAARIMLVGEAPGADEDTGSSFPFNKEKAGELLPFGEPFIGRSGQLLDKLFQETLGISRTTQGLYITNTVFWRPPENRDPTQEEVAVCKPFLAEHITLIQPKVLVPIGAVAARTLLGDKLPKGKGITTFCGKWFTYEDTASGFTTQCMPILHPAYLLRYRAKIPTFQEDLRQLEVFLEKGA